MADLENYIQKMQYSRNDKEEALQVLPILTELAFAAQKGVKALDGMIRYDAQENLGRFVNKAIQLYMEAKHADQIRKVLYNTIIYSNMTGAQLLQCVVVTETVVSLYEHEDTDFIFTFLIPSYFGLDYEDVVIGVYNSSKKKVLLKDSAQDKAGQLLKG